ncbi:MAG: DNA/RNA helicase domain-containing protein [Candidatus Woesearchaeota archaeon]
MPISPNSTEGIEFNSDAEKVILEKAIESAYFKHNNRHLFHSLEITDTGNRKRLAEADFVYLDDNFLLFFEVKGGSIKYDSLRNEWWVMGGMKKQDPFKQAKDIWFQVTDRLLPGLFNSPSVSKRLIGGYGVLFPDALKPSNIANGRNNTIEYHSDLIYDFKDHQRKEGLINYLERIKNFWAEHSANKNRITLGISTKERNIIANYFRKNLLFKLPTAHLLKKEKEEINKLTKQQTFILDNITLNKDLGAIIEGGPGTGKTVIAAELAKLKASNGYSVLFVCYNKNLSKRLKSEIDYSNCEIVNLHSLYYTLNDNKEPSIKANYTDDDFYHKAYPLYIKQLLHNKEINIFDYLIIDEAQDILNEYHFDVLGMLLKNGWESGNWSVFLDKEYQNIYGVENEYFPFFLEVFPSFINRLSLNCRNTPSILKTARITTGYPKVEALRKNEHYESEIRYGKSLEDIYSKVSYELSKDPEITRNTIILCFTNKQIEYFIERNEKIEKYPKERHENIDISTIHTFKGLEKPFVIIIGPDRFNLEDKNQISLLYVGFTRATTRTTLFLDKKYENTILNNTMKYL